MSKISVNRLWLIPLYVAFLLLYGWYQRSAPIMYLDAVIHSDSASIAEVVYTGKNDSLQEQHTSKQSYQAGETRLLLPIYQASIATLRFDPSQSDNPVTISRLRIIDRVGVVLDNVALSRVRPGDQITDITVATNGLVIRPIVAANDPFVFVDIGTGISAPEGASIWPEILLLSLLAFPALWCLLGRTEPRPPRVYPILLATVFGLVLVAASVMVTSRSVNPDEAMHVAAARYYLDNWLPPAVGDSRVAGDPEAYGGWGFSYLDEWDVCYFFAGKLAVVLAPLVADETVRFRLFNVVLLGVLFRLFLSRRWAYPLAPLLLASPQIWYVFSYFNADAFALTSACVAVFYLTDRKSFLFDSSTSNLRHWSFWRKNWRPLAIQALLLALVVLSKRNFWSAIPFVLLIFLVRLGLIRWAGIALAGTGLLAFTALNLESSYSFSQPHVSMLRLVLAGTLFVFLALLAKQLFSRTAEWPYLRQTTAKLALLVSLATLLAAPRILWDVAINGAPAAKAASLMQNENRYAIATLKPEAIRQGHGMPTNHLMDKGVPLFALFDNTWKWPAITVNSLFGRYGYMEYLSASATIHLLAISAALLGAIAIWQVRREGGNLEVFVTILMMLVVVGNSVLASWIVGFQAQGRYLFPLLPFAFWHLNTRLSPPTAHTATILTVISTVLGICGFLGYGLSNLMR